MQQFIGFLQSGLAKYQTDAQMIHRINIMFVLSKIWFNGFHQKSCLRHFIQIQTDCCYLKRLNPKDVYDLCIWETLQRV
jgi:hypothetical protein